MMTTGTDNREATAEETQQPGSAPAEMAQSPQTPSGADAASSAADPRDARIAQLEQTIKSLEGRVSRSGADPALQAQVDDIRLTLRRQEFREERRAIRESDLPEGEQAQELAKVEQRERQTEESQSFAEWQRETLAEMVDDLAASGIPVDDPKVSEFSNRWVAARTKAEGQRVRREFNRFLISEPVAREKAASAAASQKAEDARKRQNQEDGTLLAGTSKGSPGGGSDYLERLKSGKPLPPSKEIDALTARYAAR